MMNSFQYSVMTELGYPNLWIITLFKQYYQNLMFSSSMPLMKTKHISGSCQKMEISYLNMWTSLILVVRKDRHAC